MNEAAIFKAINNTLDLAHRTSISVTVHGVARLTGIARLTVLTYVNRMTDRGILKMTRPGFYALSAWVDCPSCVAGRFPAESTRLCQHCAGSGRLAPTASGVPARTTILGRGYGPSENYRGASGTLEHDSLRLPTCGGGSACRCPVVTPHYCSPAPQILDADRERLASRFVD